MENNQYTSHCVTVKPNERPYPVAKRPKGFGIKELDYKEKKYAPYWWRLTIWYLKNLFYKGEKR